MSFFGNQSNSNPFSSWSNPSSTNTYNSNQNQWNQPAFNQQNPNNSFLPRIDLAKTISFGIQHSVQSFNNSSPFPGNNDIALPQLHRAIGTIADQAIKQTDYQSPFKQFLRTSYTTLHASTFSGSSPFAPLSSDGQSHPFQNAHEQFHKFRETSGLLFK